MKWITREKVKVDRVACPWLIKKFVDPHAEFIFVGANQVEAKARAIGYCTEDPYTVHHRSLRTSFSTTVETLGDLIQAGRSV